MNHFNETEVPTDYFFNMLPTSFNSNTGRLVIDKDYINYGKHTVHIKTLHNTVYINKNIVCVSCGMIGKYFKLKKRDNKTSFIFQLCGEKEIGNQVKQIIFTLDHLIPVSRGGTNSISNLQPMCYSCNNKKNDDIVYDHYKLSNYWQEIFQMKSYIATQMKNGYIL